MDSGTMVISGYNSNQLTLNINKSSVSGTYSNKNIPTSEVGLDNLAVYVERALNSELSARSGVPNHINFLTEWIEKYQNQKPGESVIMDTTTIFQVDTSVPGSSEVNNALTSQQKEFNALLKADNPDWTNRAALMLADAIAGYVPEDATNIANKVNKASGLVGDELTMVQQYILTYCPTPLGDFESAIIPNDTLTAIQNNPGPTIDWNYSNSQAGVAINPSSPPLTKIGSVIDPKTGVRTDNVFILP